MDDTILTVTVDNNFIGGAITVAMQMRGELEDKESIVVHEMRINEDNGYLDLICERKKETIN